MLPGTGDCGAYGGGALLVGKVQGPRLLAVVAAHLDNLGLKESAEETTSVVPLPGKVSCRVKKREQEQEQAPRMSYLKSKGHTKRSKSKTSRRLLHRLCCSSLCIVEGRLPIQNGTTCLKRRNEEFCCLMLFVIIQQLYHAH